MSELSIAEVKGTNLVELVARGGTRRERGAAIAAYVRGKGWRRVESHYSETYGFQTGTYARYNVEGE